MVDETGDRRNWDVWIRNLFTEVALLKAKMLVLEQRVFEINQERLVFEDTSNIERKQIKDQLEKIRAEYAQRGKKAISQ